MPTKAEALAELARRGLYKPTVDPTYAAAFAKGQATKDLTKIENAVEGVKTADNLSATSSQARKLLDEGVPTGGWGDVRLDLGRKVGNPVTSFLTGGFIPTKDTTGKMERFRQLTNEAVLGDVGKLKGPLSDRDISFLKDTQAGIDTTPGANRRALAAREWAAVRLSAYESALQRWTKDLGAPSALNPRGQSFDAFFSSWASKNIPPPTGETYTYRSPGAASAKKTGGQVKRSAAPVRVSTPEEARKLAPGTRFINPDGKEFVR